MMEDMVRNLQRRRLQLRGDREVYMHIAAVVRQKAVPKTNESCILSVGINSERHKRANLNCWGSMHAECDALLKLPRHDGRRPLNVNLIIVRTNRSGGTTNSQPCRECMFRIHLISEMKNVRVRKICFTVQDGIRVFKLDQARLLTPHVSTGFRHHPRGIERYCSRPSVKGSAP